MRRPSPARRRLPGATLLIAILSLLPSCVAVIEEPDPSLTVEEGLAGLGTVERRCVAPGAGGGDPAPPMEVVLIRDRHAVHGAITLERGPIVDVRRENRLAIGFLLAKGYTLLGCEAPFGPLADDDGPSRRHRDAVRRALRHGERLDPLSVYQPIRYEEELGGELAVLGVEEPLLHRADTDRLERILELQALAARADTDEADRRASIRGVTRLVRAIGASARLRGRIAACNLVHLMEERGTSRAILLIGGAHAEGALAALEAHGLDAWVFTCRSYDARRR